MPFRPFDDQNCSIASAVAIIGERWSLLILREVLLGRYRFQEIKRHTGIATNILSDRLQTLVEHGVLRHPEGAPPRSQEYLPTDKALDAVPVLIALTQWGDRYAPRPAGVPRIYVHTSCGHDAEPQLVCGHCSRPLLARDVRVRPGPGASASQRAEPLLPARSANSGR